MSIGRSSLGCVAALASAMTIAGCVYVGGRSGSTLDAPHLTHGVAVGEVSATTAVVWGRCDRATRLHVVLDDVPGGDHGADVGPAHDFIGKLAIDGLAPGSVHRYRAWCGADEGRALAGDFRTAPAAEDPAPVRFVFGGDIGGQNVCRDAAIGYPIFDRMRARRPDFFVALGDQIYADDTCRAVGRFGNAQVVGPAPAGATTAAFWQHWRYNRADLAWQRFLASTSYYAVWDDHEIHNDAGLHAETLPNAPTEPRLPAARAAYVDYQPFAGADRLYRSARWGRHVEMFVLDTRGYRDGNRDPDVGAQPKTMLGAEQRRWLEDGLVGSNATWKIVVSSVPLSIPTGGDGWADDGNRQGFERELLAILRRLRTARVRNLVWITTDVHFATGFRSTPFPGFHMLELTSGPLAAGFFPRRDVDPTLHPRRLYFHGPATPPTSFDQARTYFNFGELAVDAEGALTVRILTGDDATVFERRFPPDASRSGHAAVVERSSSSPRKVLTVGPART